MIGTNERQLILEVWEYLLSIETKVMMPNEHGNDQGNTRSKKSTNCTEVRTKVGSGGVAEGPRIHDAQVRKSNEKVHTT